MGWVETYDEEVRGPNINMETDDESDSDKLNFFSLLIKGGWFMIPIGVMSALVVTFAIVASLVLVGWLTVLNVYMNAFIRYSNGWMCLS